MNTKPIVPDLPLVNQVHRFLEREKLRAGVVVVAVSGGPDSVALLLALQKLAREFQIQLRCAHLNHLLRGEESQEDQEFVQSLCADHGIDFVTDRKDVRKLARVSGENLESTARRVRYEWLTSVAEKQGAAFVATGHTADDQAETVLHHLLRGTGLRGLRGIAPRRRLAAGAELVRPMLGATRRQVVEFLAALQVTARTDSSNADLSLTRNRIRHELLPRLQAEYSPALPEHLARLAEQAGELYAVVEADARRLLAEAERPRATSLVVLAVAALRAAPRYLHREVFHLVWEREGWPVGGMSFEHWERLVEMVEQADGAHDLPDGIRAVRKAQVLQLG